MKKAFLMFAVIFAVVLVSSSVMAITFLTSTETSTSDFKNIITGKPTTGLVVDINDPNSEFFNYCTDVYTGSIGWTTLGYTMNSIYTGGPAGKGIIYTNEPLHAGAQIISPIVIDTCTDGVTAWNVMSATVI
ncbi:MAG: hypothetical protein Q8N99_03865 [Nanoarchaeota archaeon]|nr:hypothetical protein [Nanoarchaeota archaeon]